MLINREFTLAAFGLTLLMFSASSRSETITATGVSPASNTYASFNDSSLTRDSELNEKLDLLSDFYPSIEVTYASHDNVRRRVDLDEKDEKFTIKPSLGYKTNLGRHKFYAAYTGIFVRHDEVDQDDVESNLFNANLGLDINKRFDLKLFGGFGQSFEERGISGSPGFNQLSRIESGTGFDFVDESTLNEVDMEFYGADLIYGRKFSRLNAVLGFEKQKLDYDGNFDGDFDFVSERTRTRNKGSWHFDVSYQFGEKTSLFARYQKSDINYSFTANDLDSTQKDYLIGLRWKPSNALSGVVGIGRSEKEYDSSLREDYDGSSYYANLSYSITPFSILTFNASKLVEEPGDQLSSYFESELLGIRWDHSLTERVSFSVYGKLIEDDFDTDRKDEFTDIGINLDYSFRRWLNIGLYYGQLERESNAEFIPYEDEYFGIRLYSDLRAIN